jgi:hypothetical protein
MLLNICLRSLCGAPEDPNRVIVDPNCVTPEEIQLVLKTMSANSFNFIEEDLNSGDSVGFNAQFLPYDYD